MKKQAAGTAQLAAGSEQVVESGRMMMKLAFLSRPRAGLAVKNLE